MKYTVGWVVLVAGFALLELFALMDPGTGDTFSEHIWVLVQDEPWLAPIGIAGLGWVAYHFFIDARSRR